MAKFMLLYRGEATSPEDMTEEQVGEVMAQWGVWLEKHGAAVLDAGSPFGARGAVGGDGSHQATSKLNGYSFVEAADLASAKRICDGHPFLHGTGADFAVEVFELAPIEM